MKLLIDGDIILYRAAFAAQHTEYHVYLLGQEAPLATFRYKKELTEWAKEAGLELGVDYETTKIPIVEPVENALYSAKHMIGEMCKRFNTDAYTLYIGGEGNYRDEIVDDYKAGRPPKPVHYEAMREYLINVQKAVVCDGQEADDAMGIAQCAAEVGTTVICSIDKDLDLIPGWHFNFVKEEFYEILPEDALFFFYKQLLTGDSVDNIMGCGERITKTYQSGKKKGQEYRARVGVGPVEAVELLMNLETEQELYAAVREAYDQHFGEEGDERLCIAGKLLWIRQEEGQMWTPPAV